MLNNKQGNIEALILSFVMEKTVPETILCDILLKEVEGCDNRMIYSALNSLIEEGTICPLYPKGVNPESARSKDIFYKYVSYGERWKDFDF